MFRKLDELRAEEFGAVAVDEDSIPAVRFTREAQGEFDAWRERLEERLRSGELSAPMEAHLAKYRCSYIQARAIETLRYAVWDLGAIGGDATVIGASRR